MAVPGTFSWKKTIHVELVSHGKMIFVDLKINEIMLARSRLHCNVTPLQLGTQHVAVERFQVSLEKS